MLRNDNPENVVFKFDFPSEYKSIAFKDLRDKGKAQFEKGAYKEAIECFLAALERNSDPEEEIHVLSDAAECFLQINLYEDGLEFSNFALDINPLDIKALLLKAKCLAYLFEFD